MGSNTATIMTLANSIIGVGVLAMPFCFKQCGIALSITMLIFSSYLSRTSCHFLLKAAIMARRRNFEFLAFHTFGPHGKTIVELFIIGFLMGTCIAFFVVVGDLGPAIVAKLFQIENTASLRQLVLVGLAAGIVLPLGLMRNVTSLSTICTATIGFYLCLVLKVISEARPHLAANDWTDQVYFWRPSGLLQCTPIFSMALFCQTQLFEIYESLPNATLERMNDVIRHAVNLCTGFYIFVGFFGYVAFYTQSFTGNILMSFTPSWVSDAIKMGFVLSVAVSFPLVIFPCRASLYSLLFKRAHMSHHETMSSHIPETRFRVLTFGIITVALTVGLITPNIELVLGLVGSTIGVLICVMFPAVAFICISTKSSRERLLAQVLLFVGVLILVLGTYATVYPTQEVEISGVEPNTLPPDRIDSIARMSLLPVEKNVPNKADNTKNIEKAAQVNLAESVKDLPPLDANAPEKQHPQKIQEVELPKIPEVEKKLDVRQEPPVPVEPPGDIPAAVPSSLPEKKEEKNENVVIPAAESNNQREEAALSNNVIKKDVVADLEVKKDIPNAVIEKDKSNNEQVNQDAIKKEEEELAEAEKQAQSDEKKKDEELLKKLEKHQEEQKKLLQEQKQILEELKEHKKELDEAAAKKKSEDVIPVVPLETKDDTAIKIDNKNKSVLLKIDQPRLIDSKLPELNNLLTNSANLQKKPKEKNMENSNVMNEINKPLYGDKMEKDHNLANPADNKDTNKLEDGVVSNKIGKNQKNLSIHDLKVISENILSSKTSKMENEKTKSAGIPNMQGLDNQSPLKEQQPLPKSQDGPIPLANKLPLPFPLAVRNMTSEFYRQQQSVNSENKPEPSPPSGLKHDSKANEPHDPGDEAKVMRREILAEDKIGLVANASKESGKIKPEEVGKAKQRDILSSVGNDKIYDEVKSEAHNRLKRDVISEEALLPTESILVSGIKASDDTKVETQDKQEREALKNCDVHDKDKTITNIESDKIDKLSKDTQESNKLSKVEKILSDDKKQVSSSNIETVSENTVEKSSNMLSQLAGDNSSIVASQRDAKLAEPVKIVHDSNKAKEIPSVVTLSSLIKTVSLLSDPKLSNTDINHLKEAVADIKDSSAVPRPMSRDLKSVSSSPQFTDENEEKEKNS